VAVLAQKVLIILKINVFLNAATGGLLKNNGEKRFV